MIRPARMGDVSAMLDVLRRNHARSVYAGKVGIDERRANAILVQCVQRHGGRGDGATWCVVADDGDGVAGLMAGLLQPVYQIGDALTAQDLFWATTGKASARDRLGLMVSFVDWAKGHRKVFDIMVSTPPTVTDPAKLEKTMRIMGFEPYGSFWRIERTPSNGGV